MQYISAKKKIAETPDNPLTTCVLACIIIAQLADLQYMEVMAVVNMDKLKEEIKRTGMTLADVASALGINPSTLFRKFNKKGETFTLKQITILVGLLQLTPETAQEIFFDEKLA